MYPYPHASPPANYIQRVARGLRRLGHDVLIIAPQQAGKASPAEGHDRFGTSYVCFAVPVKRRWTPYYPHMLRWVRPQLLQTLARVLSESQKGKWDAALLLGDSWWILDPVRRLCQSHDLRVAPLTTEWPPPTLSGLAGLSWFDQWMFRRNTCRRSDGIVGISRLWAEFAARHGVPAVVLPAFSKYADDELPPIDERANPRFKIVYVGRWVRRELPCTLLRGLELALERGVDLEMVVLGPAGLGLSWSQRAEERPAMRFLDRSPRVRERVTLMGWLADDQFEREMAAADAFVLLRPDSRQTRALFPTRLPEFLATGKPLILADAGDLTLYLKHFDSAYIIPAGDQPAALAEALAFLASNRDRAAEIGRGGRAAIQNAFSQTLLAGRAVDFIRGLRPPSAVARSI
ncbi:MAG TPA: glycosyltransferase family 4 protein [Tepidisphaeraceae bacterium]|jgi:glycosyltransferase involved in cell wall biosynthesis|nr:glycosyltransferase family 4 protein [Tepidisphaeraceae bacterium]